ncbi:MAG: hypothetical protein WAZ77_15950 [Candidatus Nitrosopolaris sp.]
MKKYLNETWAQKRKRFIKRHKSICEYYDFKKSADELDPHRENPPGGDCEHNLMLAYHLSWSTTMSIAGHPE